MTLTIKDLEKLMPGNWYAINEKTEFKVYQIDGNGCVIQYHTKNNKSCNFATFHLDGYKIVPSYEVSKSKAISFYKKNLKFSNFK